MLLLDTIRRLGSIDALGTIRIKPRADLQQLPGYAGALDNIVTSLHILQYVQATPLTDLLPAENQKFGIIGPLQLSVQLF